MVSLRQRIRRVFRSPGTEPITPDRYLQDQINRIRAIDDQGILGALDELGPFYGDLGAIDKAIADIENHGRRYLAMADLIDSLGFEAGSLDILEVGCNTGFLSLFVRDRWPDHRVVAIDKVARQIEANRLIGRTYPNPVEFVTADGAKVPDALGAAAFDVVFLCEILEHLEPESEIQHAVLRGALTAVRPGGVVVITVPYEDRIPFPGHFTEFDRGTLRALLTSEASHIMDLDAARAHYGLEKHFVFLAANEPIRQNRFAPAELN